MLPSEREPIILSSQYAVEVREMLRRWLGGKGVRAIARVLGVEHRTSRSPRSPPRAARAGRPNASAPSLELGLLRPQERTVPHWLAEGLRLTARASGSDGVRARQEHTSQWAVAWLYGPLRPRPGRSNPLLRKDLLMTPLTR